MPLAIVDPHIHLWAPRTTPRLVSPAVKLLGWSEWALRNVAPKLFPASSLAFVGKTDFVMADYLPEHWRRDAGGFEARGFVHVQAGWHDKGPLSSVGETHWLERICGDELLGIVGHAELGSESLARMLDAHREASPRFVGVRDMLANDRDRGVMNYDERTERCREAAWQRGFEELGRRDLSFDAWMYHPQLRSFEAVVSAHPSTRVILDHLGTPLGYGGPFAGYGRTKAAREQIASQWRDDLAALAQHPQVHAKISGLTMPVVGWGFHERRTPPSRTELVDSLGPMVATALELFGPQRCMFASNFPMDKVSAPWTSLYEVFDELTRTRDEGERRALFHDNAARVYGLSDALA
jgi:predicted TIM-barrel fold metal-dependent hydrolase